jgi:hypothetical protein
MQLQGKYPRVIAKDGELHDRPDVLRVGTLFTTRGAVGAVTFTLPQLSAPARRIVGRLVGRVRTARSTRPSPSRAPPARRSATATRPRRRSRRPPARTKSAPAFARRGTPRPRSGCCRPERRRYLYGRLVRGVSRTGEGPMHTNRFTGFAAAVGSLAKALVKPLAILLLAVFFKPLLVGGALLMGSAFTDTDFVRQLWAVGLLDKAGGFVPRAPVAKTANYRSSRRSTVRSATPAARASPRAAPAVPSRSRCRRSPASGWPGSGMSSTAWRTRTSRRRGRGHHRHVQQRGGDVGHRVDGGRQDRRALPRDLRRHVVACDRRRGRRHLHGGLTQSPRARGCRLREGDGPVRAG